jgi:hypothetical protein
MLSISALMFDENEPFWGVSVSAGSCISSKVFFIPLGIIENSPVFQNGVDQDQSEKSPNGDD